MTKIYSSNGWKATGGTAVAFVGTGVLILLARGPHETGWVGWSGGTQLLRREKWTDLSPNAITERMGGAQGPVGAMGMREVEREGVSEGVSVSDVRAEAGCS